MSNNPLLQSLQSSRENWIEQKMKDPWMSGFYEGWIMREHKEDAMRTVLKEALAEGHKSLLKAVVAMCEAKKKESFGGIVLADQVVREIIIENRAYNEALDIIISELNTAIEGGDTNI